MNCNKFMLKLKSHPLINTLLNLRDNQRICVYTEPLWGIPYNLYSPYTTLFMYALGIKDKQIGLLLSIGMIFQVLASLLGGIATDKLGRRKCTVIFDILSWSVPAFLWMFSQNFWWFLIAAIFNSMWQITNNSWNCLLVEDCPAKLLVDIYTWCTVSGLLAVFFAPLAGLLVAKFTVVPAMRILYGITFIMMTTKFIVLYFYSKETNQGIIRIKETKGQKVFEMLASYRDVFIQIIHTPTTMLTVAIMTLLHISSMISSNFFALYVNQNLLVPEQYIACFPMIRAIVMLLFIFTVQASINRMPFKPVMTIGAGLYVIANILLITAKPQGYVILMLYMLCEAFGYALLIPRKDSLMVLFVDPRERARILGLLFVIMIGIASPFGWISGWLSEINRTLPFILNIIIYTLCAVLALISKDISEYDNRQTSRFQSMNT